MNLRKLDIESKVLIGVVLVVLVLPALLTQTGRFLFDFSDTGEVGDTIGGITAPIVGLLGAWLVYRAFKAQIEANKIQNNALKEQARDRELDIVLKLIDDSEKKLKRELEVAEKGVSDYVYKDIFEVLKGWKYLLLKSKNEVLERVGIYLRQIKIYVDYTFSSTLMTDGDKELLLQTAYYGYILELKLLIEEVYNNEDLKEFSFEETTDIDRLAKTLAKVRIIMTDEINNPIEEFIFSQWDYRNTPETNNK